MEYWLLAFKLTLTGFAIFRIQKFIKKQRSGEIEFILFGFIILLSLAIAKNETISVFSKWLSLILFVLMTLACIEPEILFVINHFLKRLRGLSEKKQKEVISEIARASGQLALTKTGALIAFEQNDSLSQYARSGIAINADVKKDLLTTLFVKDTPTHDGCLLIRNGKMTHCAVVLPLTSQINIEDGLGTRHRAGLGLTEKTDAVCVIISEEEGSISVAKDGKLYRHILPNQLEKELCKMLGHTLKKHFYPLHYLRYFSVKEHTFNQIILGKSFTRHFYDLIVTAFWLLVYIFWNPNGFPKQIEIFLMHPWIYIPFILFAINLLAGLSQTKCVFDAVHGQAQIKWKFLFLPIFWKTYNLSDFKQVVLRREGTKTNVWTLMLDHKKSRPIIIDNGSSFDGLSKLTEKLQEFLRIEISA